MITSRFLQWAKSFIPSNCSWPYGWPVEKVSLAGMPKPSLQGRIHGVFRNRPPIGPSCSMAEQLPFQNSQHILVSAAISNKAEIPRNTERTGIKTS